MTNPRDTPTPTLNTPVAVVLDGRHLARLPKDVRDVLVKYLPQIPEAEWAVIRDFVHDAVAAAVGVGDTATINPERAVSIAGPFVYWAVNVQGLPLTSGSIFTRRVIDSYCDSLALREGSVSTYRSVLRAVADRVAPDENPEPFRPIPRRHIQDPYVTAEVEQFRAWAYGQRTPTQTRKAKLLLSVGAGAGLQPNEIGALRPRDVSTSSSGITITVPSTPPRKVTLLAEWEGMFREAIDGVHPDSYVWVNSPTMAVSKNLVSEFTARCIGVAPVLTRLRASWLVTLLDRRVHMAVIFDASGFKQFNNLYQYVPYLTKPGSSEARAQLRSGGLA